jgi:hypothetical protein
MKKKSRFYRLFKYNILGYCLTKRAYNGGVPEQFVFSIYIPGVNSEIFIFVFPIVKESIVLDIRDKSSAIETQVRLLKSL